MYKILPITVSDYVFMYIFTECWETIPDQMTQILSQKDFVGQSAATYLPLLESTVFRLV